MPTLRPGHEGVGTAQIGVSDSACRQTCNSSITHGAESAVVAIFVGMLPLVIWPIFAKRMLSEATLATCF